MSGLPLTARGCADAFARGECSARELAESALVRIAAANPGLNAYTAVTAERALAEADALDAARRRGETTGSLAGVPYGVKNLFDVAGLTTLAGARILADNPPATRDAELVARTARAGGLLTGTLNMDALAYGFTTENSHYGATRNPHDPARTTGGSSGGSAAGLVPLALASDTNGSIRVPASFCGIFGLKPTYGRLPRTGSFPFVDSLDHLGPLASTAENLALAYDALQEPDPADHACAQRPPEPTLDLLSRGIEGLRIARLGGISKNRPAPPPGLPSRWPPPRWVLSILRYCRTPRQRGLPLSSPPPRRAARCTWMHCGNGRRISNPCPATGSSPVRCRPPSGPGTPSACAACSVRKPWDCSNPSTCCSPLPPRCPPLCWGRSASNSTAGKFQSAPI